MQQPIAVVPSNSRAEWHGLYCKQEEEEEDRERERERDVSADIDRNAEEKKKEWKKNVQQVPQNQIKLLYDHGRVSQLSSLSLALPLLLP